MTSLNVIQPRRTKCVNDAGVPDCGKCCRLVAAPPYTLNEIRELSGKLQRRIMAYLKSCGNDAPGRNGGCCIFLVDGACSVYDERPAACRREPMPGDDTCERSIRICQS